MAKRSPLVISEEERLELKRDRYEHPHPRVQQSRRAGRGPVVDLAGRWLWRGRAIGRCVSRRG